MPPDAPFVEQQMAALGRNIALVFQGLIENGMERGEALEIVKEWVRTAMRPNQQPSDD